MLDASTHSYLGNSLETVALGNFNDIELIEYSTYRFVCIHPPNLVILPDETVPFRLSQETIQNIESTKVYVPDIVRDHLGIVTMTLDGTSLAKDPRNAEGRLRIRNDIGTVVRIRRRGQPAINTITTQSQSIPIIAVGIARFQILRLERFRSLTIANVVILPEVQISMSRSIQWRCGPFPSWVKISSYPPLSYLFMITSLM
jgi:hypothetical protein